MTVEVTPLRTCSELVDKAKRGDVNAFGQLYSTNRRRVFALCLRMASDVDLAEDLTQETFVLAFSRLKTFRGDAAFSTWIHQIAVNVVLMHFRKNRRSGATMSIDALQEENESFTPLTFGTDDGHLEKSIDRVGLERAIESLSPGYRLILILHDIEGYQHQEIAELLGCSVGTTKSQLHKARLRMRSLLNENASTLRVGALQIAKRRRVQGASRRFEYPLAAAA